MEEGKKNRGRIRAFQRADLTQVMKIWLDANQEAHGFIPGRYWEENFAAVEAQLPQAEIYVWETIENPVICGFLGIQGEYIAGIFVESQVRSQGIGKELLQHIKRLKNRLTLHVYQKNERAICFYQREGFRICL